MKKMKAVQVNLSGEFEVIEKDCVMPTVGQVRINVAAVGLSL